MVRETCNNTKLRFSSMICRTDLKVIDGKVIKTNTNLENYCKQQNLDFIDNSNIKKSDLSSRGLHLHGLGSSKLRFIFIFIEFVLQVIVFLTNLNKVRYELLKN